MEGFSVYGVNLCIQSEYRKIRTRKNSVFGHFSGRVYFEEDIDVVSYADDNTPYQADSNIDDTISSFGFSSGRLFNWF